MTAFLYRGLLVAGLLLMTACVQQTSAQYKPRYSDARTNLLISSNHLAAEILIAQLQDSLPEGSGPLIVTTLVDINDLQQSSTLGRLISEQVAARFNHAGYKMVEMKFGNTLYIRKQQGEMMLTREVHELAAAHDAKAVVVGTYSKSRNYVFINLKVVQPDSSAVLAVHDYALPATPSIASMLRSM